MEGEEKENEGDDEDAHVDENESDDANEDVDEDDNCEIEPPIDGDREPNEMELLSPPTASAAAKIETPCRRYSPGRE